MMNRPFSFLLPFSMGFNFKRKKFASLFSVRVDSLLEGAGLLQKQTRSQKMVSALKTGGKLSSIPIFFNPTALRRAKTP